jgi:hypothetical protein
MFFTRNGPSGSPTNISPFSLAMVKRAKSVAEEASSLSLNEILVTVSLVVGLLSLFMIDLK